MSLAVNSLKTLHRVAGFFFEYAGLERRFRAAHQDTQLMRHDDFDFAMLGIGEIDIRVERSNAFHDELLHVLRGGFAELIHCRQAVFAGCIFGVDPVRFQLLQDRRVAETGQRLGQRCPSGNSNCVK